MIIPKNRINMANSGDHDILQILIRFDQIDGLSHDHTQNRIIWPVAVKFSMRFFRFFQKHEVKRTIWQDLTHDRPYQSDKNEFWSNSTVNRLYKLFTRKNISELLISFFKGFEPWFAYKFFRSPILIPNETGPYGIYVKCIIEVTNH